ncbi:MAG: hypothetical protein WA435_04040 [Gallionellaceae bacterium]
MVEQMWAILTTISEESQNAALSKCTELGLDTNRGIISLDESFINLNAARHILMDAIEKKKLIQLPITVQKVLLSQLEAISKSQTSLIAGADEVINLTNAIENLNTSIWQYGLHNLSAEVLGYQTKLNQLKALEVEARELNRVLNEGVKLKEQLVQILTDASKQGDSLLKSSVLANEAATKVNEELTRTIEAGQKASAVLTTIQQNETVSSQLLAATTKSNAEILALETNIKTLVSGFTLLKGELEANKDKQQQLFIEFESHRNTINDLLGDANRTGMAASFTNRRLWLLAPMAFWLSIFAVSIGGLIYMGSVYIAPILNADNFNLNQLPSRLALTAPFIWLGWFSAKQYGYSSRLREDYAYKEASAKSFEGYKREASQVSADMLKNLLETAINNLGDNPIRIYSGHENHASPLHEILEKSLKDEKAMDLIKAIFAKARG